MALIFSGQYVKYVSSLRKGLPIGADPWGHSLKLLMGAVMGGGAVIVALMAYMQTNVLTDPACVDPNMEKKRKKGRGRRKRNSKGRRNILVWRGRGRRSGRRRRRRRR